MRSSGARVLKMSPRVNRDELPINEDNLKIVLHYLGTTEEKMLESFYEDNLKDKLIIANKEKFRKDYIKAYMIIHTEKAERYSDCS